jgi:hypothetical protein
MLAHDHSPDLLQAAKYDGHHVKDKRSCSQLCNRLKIARSNVLPKTNCPSQLAKAMGIKSFVTLPNYSSLKWGLLAKMDLYEF